MGNRPTINDLAQAAGVSVATVDRVLNRRLPVREGTAERVLRAAEQIGYHAIGLLRQRLKPNVPARTLGFLLQKRDAFYTALSQELVAATQACPRIRGKPFVDFVEELSPSVMAKRLMDAGVRCDAVAVVAVDHPYIWEAVQTLREKGVPVCALISDVNANGRAAYVGRDNRKEGRTAAWVIHRTARRPGKVGIIVGSHRYLCQETAEISFRSYFREIAPDFQLLEPLLSLDDPRIASEAATDLLSRNPDLIGLYVCAGGTDGVIEAARAEALDRSIAIVCHELTGPNRAALIDGLFTAVISTPQAAVANQCVETLVDALQDMPDQPRQFIVPFDLFVSENI